MSAPSVETQIPIHLMGGTHRCARCSWSWQPDTWVCREPSTANSSICRYCATADPALRIWQRYCDIADQLDQIMQAAADPELRGIIAEMLSRDVQHFAVWRDGPEGHEVCS